MNVARVLSIHARVIRSMYVIVWTRYRSWSITSATMTTTTSSSSAVWTRSSSTSSHAFPINDKGLKVTWKSSTVMSMLIVVPRFVSCFIMMVMVMIRMRMTMMMLASLLLMGVRILLMATTSVMIVMSMRSTMRVGVVVLCMRMESGGSHGMYRILACVLMMVMSVRRSWRSAVTMLMRGASMVTVLSFFITMCHSTKTISSMVNLRLSYASSLDS